MPPTVDQPSSPALAVEPWRWRRWHWILLAIGLVLRLALSWKVLHDDPFGGWDGKEYYAYSWNLMHGLGDEYAPRIMNFVRAPLYPIFLIPFRALTSALWPIAAVQSLLGCLQCVVLARMASRWAGPRAGGVALVLAVVNPFLIYPCGFVLSENLFITTAWLGMACLFRLGEKPPADPWRWVMWGGFWWGLACLTRSALLPFLPVAAVWIGVVAWRRGGFGAAFRQMTVFTAVCCALLLPWMVGNFITYREFTVAARQAPMIAALSNSPEYLASYEARSKDDYYRLFQGLNDRLAAPPADRQLAYWRSELEKFKTEHRDDWHRLQRRKVVHFWTPWLNPLIFPRSQFLISVAWNVPLFLGAALGLWRQRWDAFVWLLLGLVAVTFVVHFWLLVAVRYRYPTVDVAFLLLSARWLAGRPGGGAAIADRQ